MSGRRECWRSGCARSPVGTAVAIRHRQADALAVAPEQHEINAPGINPDGVDQNARVADVVQAGAALYMAEWTTDGYYVNTDGVWEPAR